MTCLHMISMVTVCVGTDTECMCTDTYQQHVAMYEDVCMDTECMCMNAC